MSPAHAHRARHRAPARFSVIAATAVLCLVAALSSVGLPTPSTAAFTDTGAVAVEVASGDGVPFTAVSAAGGHACAVDDTDRVWCWGRADLAGGAGDSTRGNFTVPTLFALPTGVATVSAGYEHTCALGVDGRAWCWGTNAYGQRGPGAGAPSTAAATGVTQLDSSGGYHSCTLDAAGVAWCWGMGSSFQLGSGSTSGSSTPVRVANAPGAFAAVDTGYMFTCGLSGGRVYCWGNNASGQVTGTPTTASVARPSVIGPSSIRDFAAGGWSACALDAAGAAWCWGSDEHGQRGDGSATSNGVTAVDTALRFESITVGDHHACALTAAGEVWCWGYNVSGQLGDGTLTSRTSPVRAQLPDASAITSITAGGYFTCAIDADQRTWCWGAADGAGTGQTQPSLTPAQPTVPWR